MPPVPLLHPLKWLLRRTDRFDQAFWHHVTLRGCDKPGSPAIHSSLVGRTAVQPGGQAAAGSPAPTTCGSLPTSAHPPGLPRQAPSLLQGRWASREDRSEHSAPFLPLAWLPQHLCELTAGRETVKS